MTRVLLIVLLALSHFAIAQEQSTPEQNPVEPSVQNPQTPQEMKLPQQFLEEITVRGERTFFSIRSQIRQAENAMYALFNELNNNDDFDIFCRNRKRGSHIARRECEPKFITRARQRNSVMAMRGIRDSLDSAGGFAGSAGDFSATNGSPMFEAGLDMILTEDEIAEGEVTKIEAMQVEMLRIATENPEYLEALMRVGKLKQVLSEERMKKFGVP